jgi:hypothetical protein
MGIVHCLRRPGIPPGRNDIRNLPEYLSAAVQIAEFSSGMDIIRHTAHIGDYHLSDGLRRKERFLLPSPVVMNTDDIDFREQVEVVFKNANVQIGELVKQALTASF